MLKPLDPGTGFLKASFFGEAGAGKTTTATKLALGTRAYFRLDGPIVFFDTENGSPFVAKWIKQETGLDPLGVKSRSFDDLKKIVPDAIEAKASVLIVDSVSHCWDELNATYLRRINEARAQARKSKLDRLEFQHLNTVKTMWGEWTSLFLNSPLHIITLGRLQNKWEMEENDSGKKELVKVGTRFRAEREFGHEASILVAMTSEQEMDEDRTVRVLHRAFVEKDRNPDPKTTLVGKSCDDPGFEFFRPHLETLTAGMHSPIDMSRTTPIVVDEQGNAEWQREKRDREIAIEELQAQLDKAGLGGTSNEAKASRARLLEECFGTAAKTKLENTRADALRGGLAKLRVRLDEIKGAQA